MPSEAKHLEQAVSRTLRDNLERLQRATEELSTAVADLVAACGSNRPANTLPPMMRAQASAASLTAMLEVLSKFVTRALQPAPEAEEEREEDRAIAIEPPERPAAPTPPIPRIPTPMGTAETPAAGDTSEPTALEEPRAPRAPIAEPRHDSSASILEGSDRGWALAGAEAAYAAERSEQAAEEVAEQAAAAQFDVAALPAEAQELHRRANRVAKVSMQDIKLLRPEQVRLGREHRDLCLRLRDDIEKAHKEYERRFHPILGHPVDYFYHWMVEILGEGDAQALGEYPYSSPVARQ
jgi:uncharacterized damage-inducible protein DinB